MLMVRTCMETVELLYTCAVSGALLMSTVYSN